MSHEQSVVKLRDDGIYDLAQRSICEKRLKSGCVNVQQIQGK